MFIIFCRSKIFRGEHLKFPLSCLSFDSDPTELKSRLRSFLLRPQWQSCAECGECRKFRTFPQFQSLNFHQPSPPH